MIAALVLSLCGADAAALLQNAQDAFRQGEWARADRAFSRAQASAALLDDRSTVLEAGLGRMDLRLQAREPDSASRFLPAAPDPGLSPEDSTLWCTAKARLQQARGSDSALRTADSALRVARRNPNRALVGWAFLVRARIHLARGQFAEAGSDLDQVHSGDSPVLPARIALLRAQVELGLGRIPKARALALEASTLALRRGDVPAIVESLPVRARTEEADGDKVAARASWKSLLSTAKSTGLPHHAKDAQDALERLGVLPEGAGSAPN